MYDPMPTFVIVMAVIGGLLGTGALLTLRRLRRTERKIAELESRRGGG